VPDDATADYLHQVFAPTARAVDGLEKALAGLGLLDQALALDLRRPRTTTTGCGTCPSAPPTSPPRAAAGRMREAE
jgi:hypothetical protein